jgi:polar amino acid transport system substrate-binding protein
VVIGLGLLGQITCMLLAASGCRVLGIDIDESKVALASNSGAESAFIFAGAAEGIISATGGRGADAVIITAASDSAGPIEMAGNICRDRGKVVAVGAVKLDVPRKVFYDKELELRLSRSYGPGRYDYYYEEAGRDYPYGYVRWTENRNMQSFLQLISAGKINVKNLITHRFAIEDAPRAYEIISGKTGEKYLGVVIDYPEGECKTKPRQSTAIENPPQLSKSSKVAIGFIGAGNFASGVLLPNIAAIGAYDRIAILSGSGVSAATSAERFGFRKVVSAASDILNGPEIAAVFIANRHDQHAALTVDSLLKGKPTFVEKPLCLTRDELENIMQAHHASGTPLMIGFNRRFAPFIEKIKAVLDKKRYPVSMHYRVNAGFIPSGTWIQDAESGGGRIIGEVCHFVDLLSFIASTRPVKIGAEALSIPDEKYRSDDNLQVIIKFEDGSVGTINYVASGNKAISKEYLEIFGSGTAIVMDDFKRLTIIGDGGRRTEAKGSQNKGHRKMLEVWGQFLQTNQGSPIPFEQIVDTTLATFGILDSLATGVSKWMNA